MGGSALLAKSGIESTRLTLSEFDRVQSAVISTLNDLGIRSLTIPFIKSKTDFGDIDIIFCKDSFKIVKLLVKRTVSERRNYNFYLQRKCH